MFAYCLNRPVVGFDSTGNAFHTYENKIPGIGILDGIVDTGCGGGGGVPGSGGETGRQRSREVIQREIDYYNNTDETVVLEAEFIAFYKGATVVKLPFMGTDAFSFGLICMGTGVKDCPDAISTVQHEYGHFLHFNQIGAINYTIYAAIPSLVGYWTNVPYEEYYSQPWEYCADILGGVNRIYNGSPYPYSTPENTASLYWILTMIP